MKAEQGLMREGTPLEEVQQLCDLHSALSMVPPFMNKWMQNMLR